MSEEARASILLLGQKNDEFKLLRYAFEQVNMTVASATNLEETHKVWQKSPTDAIVLFDTQSNGYDRKLIKQLRELTICFVCMITEPLEESEQMRAIADGVDWVCIKPYSAHFFCHQLHALLRRFNGISPAILPEVVCGHMKLNLAKRILYINQSPQRLSKLEAQFLWVLMRQPEQVVSAEDLMEQVWGYVENDSSQSLHKLVWRVRQKIETNPKQPQYLITVNQDGYYFSHI